MAMSEEPAGRPEPGDIYFVDPFEVEVREQFCCRDRASDDERILEMAVSLHVHGQRRAVECCNEEGHLILVHGFIRLMAARMIRTGFRYVDPESNEEIRVKDRRFSLKVVLATSSST